jgi:hypothetical protein
MEAKIIESHLSEIRPEGGSLALGTRAEAK